MAGFKITMAFAQDDIGPVKGGHEFRRHVMPVHTDIVRPGLNHRREPGHAGLHGIGMQRGIQRISGSCQDLPERRQKRQGIPVELA